jgi:hypothetical protein
MSGNERWTDGRVGQINGDGRRAEEIRVMREGDFLFVLGGLFSRGESACCSDVRGAIAAVSRLAVDGGSAVVQCSAVQCKMATTTRWELGQRGRR